MKKIKDIAGSKFAKLTVVNLSNKRSSCGRVLWDCLCECGEKITAETSQLNNGRKLSCGCIQREYARERATSFPIRS